MSFAIGDYENARIPFLASSTKYDYPYFHYWQNNPLDETSWVASRKAGYNPYKSYMAISQVLPMRNLCATYQTSCDIILPASKCYKETNEIVHQP